MLWSALLLCVRVRVCARVPVNNGGGLVAGVVCHPDVTLMKLHSDRLIVAVIEQDAVVLCG